MLAKDGELAEIYSRMLAGEQLDGTEYVTATAFLTTYFVWLEKVFLQAYTGVGYIGFKDSEDHEQFCSVIGSHVRKFLKTPTGRRWWFEYAPKQFMNEFRISVDS